MDIFERPAVYMKIHPIRLLTVGQPAIGRALERLRSLCAAVDRSAVALHPLTDSFQPVDRTLVEFTTAGRTYIQQQITSLAYNVDQHFHQHIYALPRILFTV